MNHSVQRQSNIELLRIVAMFFVVAHHYVVNSGVNELFDFSKPVSANTLFLQWWGMWGKTAINVFVIITGYFMCGSKLTVRRILKLYLEVQFYLIVGHVALMLAGYERMATHIIINLLFWPLMGLNQGFAPSFIVFYAFIPLYNIIIDKLSRKELLFWTSLLVGMYAIPFSFLGNHDVFNYVGWYVALYFVGAYVKRDSDASALEGRWFDRNIICVPLLLFSVVGSLFGSWLYGWNVLHNWPSIPLKCIGTFFGVAESCSFMAFVIGALMFLVFRNLNIHYNRVINHVASTTFGILLIHTFSDGMRSLLWRDIVDVVGVFREAETSGHSVIGSAILTVVSIFIICSCIDYARIRLIEQPFFNKLKAFKQ